MKREFRAVVSGIGETGFSYRILEVLSGDLSEVGRSYTVFHSYFPWSSIKVGDELLLSRDDEQPRDKMWTLEVLSTSDVVSSAKEEIARIRELLKDSRVRFRRKWRDRVHELKRKGTRMGVD